MPIEVVIEEEGKFVAVNAHIMSIRIFEIPLSHGKVTILD